MKLYLVRDKHHGLYFMQDAKPFFFAFSSMETAEQFTNSHPGTELEEQEIHCQEEDDFLISSLYHMGYKGGYVDGVFKPINQTNPELTRFIPENAGLLNLLVFQETKNPTILKNQRYYFFATVTQDGYLAFANSNGYIFSFTDIENVDTALAKTLYQKGYEVIKHYMDENHCYLINPNKPTQLILGKQFEFQKN